MVLGISTAPPSYGVTYDGNRSIFRCDELRLNNGPRQENERDNAMAPQEHIDFHTLFPFIMYFHSLPSKTFSIADAITVVLKNFT